MKKKFLAGLATGLLMVGVAGLASANTLEYDPSDILISTSGTNNVEYTFDIKAASPAFYPGIPGDPGVDILTYAQLAIYTYDNNDNASERYKLTLDLELQTGTFGVTNHSIKTLPSLTDISVDSYLQPDGLLTVKVTAQAGNFYLDKEILTYEFDKGHSGDNGQVPEPATMLLFGTGLIGLAGLGRKIKA